MSDGANVEVTLTVQNNSEVEMGDVVDGYAADQAREYKEKAGEYAVNALNSQNMAEAWAESDSAPAGEGTREYGGSLGRKRQRSSWGRHPFF